jgi:hypothetical protein
MRWFYGERFEWIGMNRLHQLESIQDNAETGQDHIGLYTLYSFQLRDEDPVIMESYAR